MKFTKRLLAWMLSVVMVFGLTGTLAFANETETDPNYNHGTIAVKADDSNGTITMVKGGTAEITVSPYIHVQYQGCQMPDCPEMCGGKSCFTEGMGCVCGFDPTERTATVTVTSTDEGVIKAGAAEAAGTVTSQVGSKADGKVTLTAEAAGEAKITVKASLCDWVSTTQKRNGHQHRHALYRGRRADDRIHQRPDRSQRQPFPARSAFEHDEAE